MLAKCLTLFLILQIITSSFASETEEVIDTIVDLVNSGGSQFEAFYAQSASELAGYLPDNVTNHNGIGYWLFSSSKPVGAGLAFRVYTTIEEISLTYYCTNDLDVTYRDIAADPIATKVVMKSTKNKGWTTTKFPLARNFIDTQKGVMFNFSFREANTTRPASLLLLDSISVTYSTEAPSTTPSKSTTAVPAFTTILTVFVTALLAAIIKQ